MTVRLDVERALTERSDRTTETEPAGYRRRAWLSLGRRAARRRAGASSPVDGSSALRYLYQHSVA